MAEISAATVMKLRKMSGQGMMDCKKALGETNGDLEAAMELLRKKGLATLEKRAGRETSEGRIVCKQSDDKSKTVLVSLCCETDFVAKSDDFVAAAEALADYALAADAEEGGQSLMDTELNGKKYSQLLTDTVSKTGEKTEVGDYVRYSLDGNKAIGAYVHFNNKTGAIVEIETSSPEAAKAVETVANEIAMHITAMKPAAVDQDTIDPSILQKEREIAAEQVTNKPANIVEKIVEGKVNKFLKDNCLVDQSFVKDDSMTVREALAQAAKSAGGTAQVKRFTRLEIG